MPHRNMESFKELSLSAPIQRAIDELGFEKPSPIQAQALPILLGERTDFMGLAATGTGKTAAFGIPLLERLDPSIKGVQALILCPTRELALQVSGQISLLGKYKNVKTLAIYGGGGYGDQLHGLKNGVQVVVGTPGRMVDHINRGTLKLDQLQICVLDEADEMISMGFKDDLELILGAVPEGQCDSWLFSATMSPEVRRVADKYLHEPQSVQVNRTEMLPDTLEQIYYPTQENNKPEVICKLIEAADDFYGLIFCQTKSLVVDLTQYLRERSYAVDCLHGDMDQNARERAMRAFRERKTTVLVCTDVASRGLDVKDITHVINYSLPRELDSYVHRIGRTARSGKSGYAMSLVTYSHRGLITRIERMTKSRMKEGKIPTRKEIGTKKVTRLLPEIQKQEGHVRAAALLSPEWKEAIAAMSPEEITGRFLALMHPDLFGEAEAKPAERKPGDAAGVVVRSQPREESRKPREFAKSRSFASRDERPSRAPAARSEFRKGARSDDAYTPLRKRFVTEGSEGAAAIAAEGPRFGVMSRERSDTAKHTASPKRLEVKPRRKEVAREDRAYGEFPRAKPRRDERSPGLASAGAGRADKPWKKKSAVGAKPAGGFSSGAGFKKKSPKAKRA